MNAQAPLLSKIILQVTETKRAAIRESVASGAALNGSYLAMNLAAAMIAGFGLLENSPAVIIGAMLIAMLYGPIVGIGLGLAEANLPLAPVLGNRPDFCPRPSRSWLPCLVHSRYRARRISSQI